MIGGKRRGAETICSLDHFEIRLAMLWEILLPWDAFTILLLCSMRPNKFYGSKFSGSLMQVGVALELHGVGILETELLYIEAF